MKNINPFLIYVVLALLITVVLVVVFHIDISMIFYWVGSIGIGAWILSQVLKA